MMRVGMGWAVEVFVFQTPVFPIHEGKVEPRMIYISNICSSCDHRQMDICQHPALFINQQHTALIACQVSPLSFKFSAKHAWLKMKLSLDYRAPNKIDLKVKLLPRLYCNGWNLLLILMRRYFCGFGKLLCIMENN